MASDATSLVRSASAPALLHLCDAHAGRAAVEFARRSKSKHFPPEAPCRERIEQRVAHVHARPVAGRRAEQEGPEPRHRVVVMEAARGCREPARLERRQLSAYLADV